MSIVNQDLFLISYMNDLNKKLGHLALEDKNGPYFLIQTQ
jgi:hypothetical protein